MSHKRFEGVRASEAANYLCRPLKDVIDACEKLDQNDPADIEKTKELI
ncbi:MAG: hypothetical protein WBZ29_00210 [Methanocella sp.]